MRRWPAECAVLAAASVRALRMLHMLRGYEDNNSTVGLHSGSSNALKQYTKNRVLGSSTRCNTPRCYSPPSLPPVQRAWAPHLSRANLSNNVLAAIPELSSVLHALFCSQCSARKFLAKIGRHFGEPAVLLNQPSPKPAVLLICQ